MKSLITLENFYNYLVQNLVQKQNDKQKSLGYQGFFLLI